VFASGFPAEGAKRRDNGGKRLLGHNSLRHDALRAARALCPSPGPLSPTVRRVGALMRSPALPDLCFEIVSERLETSVPLGCSFDRGQLEAPARPGLSLSLRLAKSTPLSLAPILLRLPCHRWCIRVFHLEPIGRSAGAIGRASASTRFPQGPSCRRAQTPLASCLISCSHASPDGGSGAFIGRHGGGKGTRQHDAEIARKHGSGEELVQQLLEGILSCPPGRRRSLEIDR
jgi:hypothetical protein